jgi:aconitate hydratase
MCFAGSITFNPTTDTIPTPNGPFKFAAPSGDQLPSKGYDAGVDTFVPPAADGSKVEVIIDPKSQRLQRLEPFDMWDGKDLVDMPILIKVGNLFSHLTL